MATAPTYTTTGKKSGTTKLPEMFNAPINPQLMAQAVRVYLSNQRQSSAHTLRRADVNLTKRKAYRQKGTGNARHGAKSAPIFVGGGIAHGPNGEQNYKRTMSKNMRRQALASVLSLKTQENQVSVIKDLSKLDTRTKAAQETLKSLKLDQTKVTLITDSKNDNINQAWKNIKNVQIVYAPVLNTYQLLNGGHLVIMEAALPVIETTYQAKKNNHLRTPQTPQQNADNNKSTKTTTTTKKVVSTSKKTAAKKTTTKSTAKKK